MTKIDSILSEARDNSSYASAYDWETKCQIHNRLYGENSCFLIAENYQGLYQDDYASFVYYSNITGERFEDRWTTAACCPNYDNYKQCITFDKAVKEGLINIDLYNSNWSCSPCKISDFLKQYPDQFINYKGIFPFVKVYRGRSFKNRKGWRVGEKTIVNKGYSTVMDVIFDPEVNDFFMVKKGYTTLEDNFITSVEDATNAYIDEEMKITHRLRTRDPKVELNILSKLFFGKDFNEWRCDIDIKRSIWEAKYEAEQNKIKYAPSEKLIQWVREHFINVTDEQEIYNIAYRINKKNGRY